METRRIRHRQGPVHVVGGVPYPDQASTLSLLPVSVVGRWLADNAGATKAIVFQLASLTDVQWQMSGEVVLMTLLGGMGTLFGPVVGAFTIISLEHFLADRGQWVTVTTGAIFVVCVLAFRRGVVGELSAWWERRRR